MWNWDTHGCSISFYKRCVSYVPLDTFPLNKFLGGRTITDIDTSELLIPVVVIDVSEDVLKDSDYTLTTNNILNWEEIHGPIPENSFVIMKTGWSSRYQDASLYLNFDEDNTMHFPGFSKEAAELLIHHRTIVGIGIDTASTDPGLSSTFDVHKVVLGASKFQIENLNLHQPIPSVGAFGIVLPLKLDQAPEAPVRILFLFND